MSEDRPTIDVVKTLDMQGRRGRDRITGLEGVVTAVSFDLFGCVQVTLNPGLTEDGKLPELVWFDVQRIELTRGVRVMEPPRYGFGAGPAPSQFDNGPERKAAPRA